MTDPPLDPGAGLAAPGSPPPDPGSPPPDPGSPPPDPGSPADHSDGPRADPSAPDARADPSARGTPAAPAPGAPLYKGEPLEADRGPGLGCFWTQVVVLVAVLLFIPFGVTDHWPIWATGLLLALAMVLVLFVSLTMIFLLRLVSADRRARRRPLRSGARPTVGQLEDGEEAVRQ